MPPAARPAPKFPFIMPSNILSVGERGTLALVETLAHRVNNSYNKSPAHSLVESLEVGGVNLAIAQLNDLVKAEIVHARFV